jgi:hypothetical protein
VDQRGLLISLLRRSGHACRYVHGRVFFDAEEIAGLLGVENVTAAALNAAGLNAVVNAASALEAGHANAIPALHPSMEAEADRG